MQNTNAHANVPCEPAETPLEPTSPLDATPIAQLAPASDKRPHEHAPAAAPKWRVLQWLLCRSEPMQRAMWTHAIAELRHPNREMLSRLLGCPALRTPEDLAAATSLLHETEALPDGVDLESLGRQSDAEVGAVLQELFLRRVAIWQAMRALSPPYAGAAAALENMRDFANAIQEDIERATTQFTEVVREGLDPCYNGLEGPRTPSHGVVATFSGTAAASERIAAIQYEILTLDHIQRALRLGGPHERAVSSVQLAFDRLTTQLNGLHDQIEIWGSDVGHAAAEGFWLEPCRSLRRSLTQLEREFGRAFAAANQRPRDDATSGGGAGSQEPSIGGGRWPKNASLGKLSGNGARWPFGGLLGVILLLIGALILRGYRLCVP